MSEMESIIMTLDEFIVKFIDIKESGFVPTLRAGDGGVGHTFEQLLGLVENNDQRPDLGGNEIKVARINTKKGTASGMQTLFCKEGDWQQKQTDFVLQHGWEDDNTPNRFNAYHTITQTTNSKGFRLNPTEDRLEVIANDEVFLTYDWESITQTFNKKFPAVIKVLAETKVIDGVEHFHYTKATRYVTMDKYQFIKMIKDDVVVIEPALHITLNLSLIHI